MSTIRICLAATLLLFPITAHALLTFDSLGGIAFNEIMALESSNPETYELFMKYYQQVEEPLLQSGNPAMLDYGEVANAYTQMLSEPGQPPAFYLYARMQLLHAMDGLNEQQEYLRVLESPDRVRSTETISEEDMTFLFDHQAVRHITQRVWQVHEFMTPDEVMQRVDKLIEKHGAYSMESMDILNQLSKYLAQVISDPKMPRTEGVRLMEKAVEYAEKANAIIEEVKAKPELVNGDEAFGIMSMGGMTYVEDAHRDLEKAKQRLANEPKEIAARTPQAAPVVAPTESTDVAQKNADTDIVPEATPAPRVENKTAALAESNGQNRLFLILAGIAIALGVGVAILRML